MSERLKPNFTAIPNVILDEIMRTLAPGATKVLFAICRYTYGWGKPEGDRISLKQLQDITGMARWSVVRSIKELGALVTITAGDPKKQLASKYQINVEISDADLVALRDQPPVSKSDQASHLARHSGVTFQRYSKERRKSGAKAPKSSSIKRSRKLTRPAPEILAAFDAFYAAYPRHVDRQPALKAWIALNPNPDLIPAIMAAVERYAAEVADTEPRFIKHPARWINAKPWTDEPPNGAGNGHAKPPEVKNLDNGMIEVDGRQMDRKTYERRFANGTS